MLNSSTCTEHQLHLVEHGQCDFETAFSCRSGDVACIGISGLCDGIRDCQDGSDETGCDICEEDGQLSCGNGQCYTDGQKCDGFLQCLNGQDEMDCEQSTPSTFTTGSGTTFEGSTVSVADETSTASLTPSGHEQTGTS